MALLPIVTVQLSRETDVGVARRRARQIAELLGFAATDRTEIATAVAEIARNTATHGGGGYAEFALEDSEPAALVVTMNDHGPGIPDLDALRAAQFKNAAGLFGAQRLTDRFDIETSASGTRVLLARMLPAGLHIEPDSLVAATRQLAADDHAEPLEEVRMQSRELVRSLRELQDRRAERDSLRHELENSRHGVAALHADLDRRVAAAVAEVRRASGPPGGEEEMAALAEMTGGIAHDFNNVLQIVTSNLEILGRNLPEEADRLRRAADNAMEGAQRAITLTRRLLDLSRR